MLIVLLVYPAQVMLGRASEASSVEVTQKQCIGDLAVSTACMSIVLNEWLYIIDSSEIQLFTHPEISN